MSTILLVIHLLVAIFLVTFILLQRSGGGALDGLGGGGNSAGSFLTARGTSNFLTKTTAILATLFFITSISLTLYYKDSTDNTNQSILDEPVQEVVVEEVVTPQAPTAEK